MFLALLVAAAAGFLALSLALWIVWPQPELSDLAGGLCSACVLTAGIVTHSSLTIAVGAVGLGFTFLRRGGPRNRKRVRRVLGDKSRQLRDTLARRIRQRRGMRPGWSPSPSR